MNLSPEQRQQAILSPLPPPTHLEAVAALRFYAAISGSLKCLAENEAALGSADCTPAINRVIGKLISDGTATVNLLSQLLGDVPRDPVAQRDWVMGYSKYAHAAACAVLQHHFLIFSNERERNPAYHEEHDHLEVLSSFFDRYAGMASA